MGKLILTVNPGSTSTKIAIFDNETRLLKRTVNHDAAVLAQFDSLAEQKDYRRDLILEALSFAGFDLAKLDAVVGRGGGLLPVEGGTYAVNKTLLTHAAEGANGASHPAQLGSLLAYELARASGAPVFVVDPPDTDELQDCARLTGIDGIYRKVHLHALNLKEAARRHAQALGCSYQSCNFVVCHLGGGVSVSAHRQGRMVDGFDIVGGEGPMAPTRPGSVSIASVLEYLQSHSLEDLRRLCNKTGGFVSHLDTSDALEVEKAAAAGDPHASLVWEAFIYQVCKCIGAMACALHGQVDGILLGGGIAHSEELVRKITEACGFIAPVTAYPGEFEMEAMAAGALRVLSGEEKAKTYTGIPVWNGFAWDEPEPEADTARAS